MTSTRESGLLLHITSLPGPGGVGDLGPEAHHMVDLLVRGGQRAWQVLPLGPTGYGDSPYQPFSAFAGNPLMVSLVALEKEGLLKPADLASPPPSEAQADYEAAHRYRYPRLALALTNLQQGGPSPLLDEFHHFCTQEGAWLDDFALFMAIKEEHGMSQWTTWDPPLRDRDPKALAIARRRLAPRFDFHRFVQWQFHRQWLALRAHANRAGIELIGDMPIFLAHDSVEVWSNRDQFLLRPDGSLLVQAGVPPDYFSATGQLWGNPLYNWERMARDGFSFWKKRVAIASELFDRVRIDHFRGFAAHWEVPGDAETAAAGCWVTGPGPHLFAALQKALGDRLRLIAEDLGIITPDVEELRDQFGFPGMRVLQFSFGSGDEEKSRPFAYRRNLVVYTSTHDNNTLRGWYYGEGEGTSGRPPEYVRLEQDNVLDYMGLSRDRIDVPGGPETCEIHWALVRLALSTVADLVILPVQDVLGLPASARMNFPGQAAGNWRFRLLPGQLDDRTLQRLCHLSRIYGRAVPRGADQAAGAPPRP